MNVDKIGGEGNYNLPIEPQGEINKVIPFEIFERILSNLDELDIQQASLVGHLWSLGSIDIAKQKEFSIIKGFTKFLYTNFSKVYPYPKQRKALHDLISDKKILDCINLIDIKKSIHGMKETLINIVKELSDEELYDLEVLSQNVVRPLFFEDFFKLAKIYKRIAEADKMPNLNKSSALYYICEALVNDRYIDKAFEVANSIPHIDSKNHAFLQIYLPLTKIHCIDKAAGKLEFENKISEESLRGPMLMSILNTIRSPLEIETSANLDKFIEIAKTMPPGDEQGYVLHDLSEELTRIGDFGKALIVAPMILDEMERAEALQDIYKGIKDAQTDPFDKGLDFIKKKFGY